MSKTKWFKQFERKTLKNYSPPIILSDEDQVLKEKYEYSFFEFSKAAWPSMDGSRYSRNWHSEVICEYLSYVRTGQIKNLICNISPRSGKTSLISILYLPWIWTTRPEVRFMYTSSGFSLSLEHSRLCMMLILSPWYQKYWGNNFKLLDTQASKQNFANSHYGQRLATSIGSIITGKGADILVGDDLNDVSDSISPAILEKTNRWLSHAWYSRQNPIIEGDKEAIRGRIIVQQRCHVLDATGFILNNDINNEWDLLVIPNEFEVDRGFVDLKSVNRVSKFKKYDPRVASGELFWPQVLTQIETDRKKRELGPIAYAGQYQQRPVQEGGSIFKKDWFRRWEYLKLPTFTYTIQCWDTAIVSKETSAYSACSTWGLFEGSDGFLNLMLLNVGRWRLEYPDLKIMVRRLAANYMINSLHGEIPHPLYPDDIYIETAATGWPLIHDLKRDGIAIHPFTPQKYGYKGDSSKETRARICSSFVEKGFIWLLNALVPGHNSRTGSYPHNEMLLEAVTTFPRGDGADIVDSMTSAILILSRRFELNYRDASLFKEVVTLDKGRPRIDFVKTVNN